jgi:hypothetical protein
MLEDKLWEKRYVIIVIVLSLIAFVYTKFKKDDSVNRFKVFFLIGISFLAIGSLLVFLVHGEIVLVECLLLQSANVSGKLILIGYSFIIISTLFFIDEAITKLFMSHK